MELSQIIEEIHLIPPDRLPEIHEFIHSLRPSPKTPPDDGTKIMKFAGCWRDMTDGEFEDFSQEVAMRRKQAFSGRASEASPQTDKA
uniref:DUF2281 domain-containing protein n=1 Tax=Candidatus Kentrum sp. DK TaxID=2126562 RepID=A0A450S2I0_9GAMM|nr:MAG: hypothetical protein BECKDK2373B_GA0170837_101143 [Candidatus Kentron sp. DK]